MLPVRGPAALSPAVRWASRGLPSRRASPARREGELVAGVLEGMRGALEDSGSEARRELGSPAVGGWDARRLEQVVTGLLHNAVKLGQGRPIEVRVVPRDGSVLRVVKDSGLGGLRRASSAATPRAGPLHPPP